MSGRDYRLTISDAKSASPQKNGGAASSQGHLVNNGKFNPLPRAHM